MRRLIASMALGLVVSAGTGVRYGWGQSAAQEQAPALLHRAAPAAAAGGTIKGTVKAGRFLCRALGLRRPIR